VTTRGLFLLVSEQLEENPNTEIVKTNAQDYCSWKVQWNDNRGEAFEEYCAEQKVANLEKNIVGWLMFIYTVFNIYYRKTESIYS